MPSAAMRAEAARGGNARPAWRKRSWWPAARRTAMLAFGLLVAVLLVRLGRTVDWPAAAAALRELPATTLLAAAAMAAVSHALYATFDLIGRRVTHHPVPWRRTLGVALVSYAFNLNVGTVVGGVAFRYRLYTRLGLGVQTIAHVVALSMLANWLGYALLGGAALMLAPPALPPQWGVDAAVLRLAGTVMLGVPLLYVAACHASLRREWRLGKLEFPLPASRVAVLQLVLSVLHWMVMAAVIWTLLQGRLPYAQVLAALLAAAVAGVIAHVPAGLGVLEATFVAMLSPRLPVPELLAALLAYRGVFYLLPLLLALPMFWVIDRGWARSEGGAAASRSSGGLRRRGSART